MKQRIKDAFNILQEVRTSLIVEEMFLSNKQTSELISKVVMWSMMLGIGLLFVVPMNGIILYHTLQPRFNLPMYSNFMIGCISYALYYAVNRCLTEDNLLSEIMNKVIAFISMFFVMCWFIFY